MESDYIIEQLANDRLAEHRAFLRNRLPMGYTGAGVSAPRKPGQRLDLALVATWWHAIMRFLEGPVATTRSFFG